MKRTATSNIPYIATWKTWVNLAILCIFMASCSKEIPSSINIEGHDIEIAHVLPNQLSVVEEIYTLNAGKKSSDSNLWYLTLRIKFLANESIEEPNNAVLQLLNEEGDELASLQLGENGLDTKTAEDFRAFVSEKHDNGEQRVFCFYFVTTDEELVRNIMENTTTCMITDIVTNAEAYPLDNTSIDIDDDESDFSDFDDDDDFDDDIDNDSSAPVDTGDWDAMLNSYEQYVNQYIKYIKKAADGDLSALAEYTELMQQAQELSEQLEQAKNEMSASQMSRYLKITQKMAEAAANM
ncbi:MAG: hypothetical protein J1F25_01160 [Prevotellaceae bacterium]|nr:hypothetical protein [Prevotellaceae bacterium]